MSWVARSKKGRGPERGALVRFAVFAAVTLLLTLFIAGQILGTSFNDRYALVATFDDVTGLLAGDKVKVAGAPVGQVKSIKVKNGKAEVRMEVDKTVRLPADSTAAVRWRNLIGQRMIYLEPGRSRTMLADGARVPHTRSVVDLGEIVNSLGPLTRSLDPNQINQVLSAFATMLDGNEGNVNLLIQNLDGLLQTFAARQKVIEQMTKDYTTVSDAIARRDRQIAQSVDNLAQLTDVFAKNSRLLDDAVVEVSGVTTNLNQVLGGNEQQLGRIVRNLARFTDTARINIDQLETMVQRLPLTLRELFAAGNGGHFTRVNVMCVNIVEGPCPFPMVLPQQDPRERIAKPSPKDLARLGSMLRGGG
ncbi:MAG TPA: MlaD family protein [Streptosporangiaceae bacterium]|jgi:phospholipid/cholesterol/gamma-HCH transport system substrate-binding protein